MVSDTIGHQSSPRAKRGTASNAHVFVGGYLATRLAFDSPGHRLAAPVEETAIGICREFIDDGEKMAGRGRRSVDFQRGRREDSVVATVPG